MTQLLIACNTSDDRGVDAVTRWLIACNTSDDRGVDTETRWLIACNTASIKGIPSSLGMMQVAVVVGTVWQSRGAAVRFVLKS